MLPVNSLIRRQPSSPTYICLACRLKSRERERPEAPRKAASSRTQEASHDGFDHAGQTRKTTPLKSIPCPEAYLTNQRLGDEAEGVSSAALAVANTLKKQTRRPIVMNRSRMVKYEANKPAIHKQKVSKTVRKFTSTGIVYRAFPATSPATINNWNESWSSDEWAVMSRHLDAKNERVGKGLAVRKQYGTPYAAKVVEMEEEASDTALDALLDVHRHTTEGREVDMTALDAKLAHPVQSRLESKKEVLDKYVPRAQRGHPDTEELSEVEQEPQEESREESQRSLHAKDKVSAQHTSQSGDPLPTENPRSHARSRSASPFIAMGMPNSSPHFHRHIVIPPTASTFQSRLIHTSFRSRQQAAAAMQSESDPLPPPSLENAMRKDSSIRSQLRQWQESHGVRENIADQFDPDRDIDEGETYNDLTRLPSLEQAFRRRAVEEDEEQHALAHFMRSPTLDLDSAATDSRFLKMGDLVELEFTRSEKESLIAVFVRRVGQDSQFLTMQGRWVLLPERYIPYSIPDWVSPDLVKPILPYLPDPQSLQERDELTEQAYMHDLAVPREVAGGLVSRMVQFHTESQEIYRRHAGTLDNAHELLAHDTDLRYGSLLTATTTLLQMQPHELPVTALFTVRKALARAGFAFNIDRRSHRLTGYLQIRSKEQVKMVENVRGWLRDWQDDMAKRAALAGEGRRISENRTPKTARFVYDFLEKVKRIVLKSRKNRDATPYGNVGPSKKVSSFEQQKDLLKVTKDLQFTEPDTELVRFIEAWACSAMYVGLPRIESLPPLLLQATGLYEDMELTVKTGWLFLQEIGTLTPHDNRVRFDQHLLLPSSQHSKPLQNLMSSLMSMQDKHHFRDSMQECRHDWKNLPVYCIDDEGAHEIDDGLSIERAGSKEWWVHAHIANPTAFFERDHALARMARHMGESIYMPERAYMMLPRWATTRHFSLAPGRPSLTISTRMDEEGNTLERKIRSGIVRNVIKLTPSEISQIVGTATDQRSEVVMTVGGPAPVSKGRKSAVLTLGERELDEIHILQRLAEKRSGIRRRAGGVFFDMKPADVDVWQLRDRKGLGWDHPYRSGSRTIEGDPIIRVRTQPLTNWFRPREDSSDILVREMMLLACETAAAWCSERQIPAIFRGVLRRPDTPDPDIFRREILEPAMQDKPDGAWPMHLGIQYVLALGGTALSSKPLRHALLGMDYYGKVTSPLRRYGDMMLHWQIEGALREEARTGRSLITSDPKADRSFLPFSRSLLDTIMLGLQPRESIITRAKSYSISFWVNMALFRAFHYDQAELPFWTEKHPTNPDGSLKSKPRCYINSQSTSQTGVMITAYSLELGFSLTIHRPDRLGLGEAQQGDIWECEVDYVDVYTRSMIARPVRLLHREEMGPKEIKEIMARFTST